MKAFEIDTRIENGKFRQNSALIKDAVKLFEGANVKLSIRKRYKKRSENQNDFYWGVWVPIFQKLFMDEWQEFKTPNEVHEILKTACNYEERVNEATGEVFKFPKTTTNLSTYDWENIFKKRVKQFALDFFNTPLPEPNEQLKLEY